MSARYSNNFIAFYTASITSKTSITQRGARQQDSTAALARPHREDLLAKRGHDGRPGLDEGSVVTPPHPAPQSLHTSCVPRRKGDSR